MLILLHIKTMGWNWNRLQAAPRGITDPTPVIEQRFCLVVRVSQFRLHQVRIPIRFLSCDIIMNAELAGLNLLREAKGQ